MRKMLAMGVLTISIASFGTCLAQNAATAFTDTAASKDRPNASVPLVTEQRAAIQD
jgi:hypothetical protein